MLRKKLGICVFLLGIVGSLFAGGSKETQAPAQGEKKEKLMVYTSMKEVLIGELRDAFVKKHPNVSFDYYSAGAGKIMAKIAAERQSKQLVCDVLWTSEVPDFYALKKEGVLEKYESPEAKYVVSPVSDPDMEFTAARLGTLGITYNTSKVKNPPKTWQDLLKPEFKDGFAIANPALSGTAMVSVGMIVNNLGWEYIEKLKANGARMGQGSGQVVDDTAAGDLIACLGVDYITIDKIKKGAPLGIVFPPEMLVIPSPVAIFKGTPNLSAAQKFVDFLLSKEGQTIIANSYTLPSRADVPILKDVGLVEPKDAVARAMKIDYLKLMTEKESIIDKFQKIMQGK
ncbi:MAG TPA: ABC transporter substrate-binding protein [Spirochaetales bacterium]|nr:ABC transporter substrate-binding protein [Spirochaetales bacterium]HOV37184.1 ABC transporter substrate-binding protein [Spirochaetales bacterium]